MMSGIEVHVVTGGGGYAGYRLGLALHDLGHQVRLIDINPPVGPLPHDIEFIKCDIRAEADVHQCLSGASCVYHLASYGMSGKEQLNRKLIEEVNISGTRNVIEGCVKQCVHRLVYTSTYNVVFGGQPIVNGDETLPYLPLDKHPDRYSRTKSVAERTLLAANGTLLSDGACLSTCALRLAGVYGPGEQRHLPRIVSYVERGLFAFTYGDPNSLVDFLHIENLVQAHIAAGQALTAHKQHVAAGQYYFISDCKPINNFEFFRPLVEGLGYAFPRHSLPLCLIYFIAFLTEMVHGIVGRVYNFQPFLTRTEVYKTAVTHYFSNDKAHHDLGYKPTIQNDMESVLKWYIEHGYARRPVRKPSYSLKQFLSDAFLVVIFAISVISLLPFVK